MDCSLPVSSVHGIFQARILEWVAFSFSRGFSWPRDCDSCINRQIFLPLAPVENLLCSLKIIICSRASIVFKLKSHNGLGQKWLLLCQESHAWFSCSGEPLHYLPRRRHSLTLATFYCWQSQVSRYSSRGNELQTVGLWWTTLESLGTLLKEALWHLPQLLGALHAPTTWTGEIRSPVWPAHEGIWSPKQCPSSTNVCLWVNDFWHRACDKERE